MPFQKGNKEQKKAKNPGYSASKRRLADSFVRGLMRDFDSHGEKVIEKVREKSPDVWLRIMAQMIPQTLEIEQTEPLSLEQAMTECVAFLTELPNGYYEQVMQAVSDKRSERTPAIEHIAAH